MVLFKSKPEINHKQGDYKFEYHFAWWPKIVGNKTIWLETYKEVYEYVIRDRHTYSLASKTWWFFPNCGGWDLVHTKRVKK